MDDIANRAEKGEENGEDGPVYSGLRGRGIVQDREYYWNLWESVRGCAIGEALGSLGLVVL